MSIPVRLALSGSSAHVRGASFDATLPRTVLSSWHPVLVTEPPLPPEPPWPAPPLPEEPPPKPASALPALLEVSLDACVELAVCADLDSSLPPHAHAMHASPPPIKACARTVRIPS